MNGPEHYKAAERILRSAGELTVENIERGGLTEPVALQCEAIMTARAQVHATPALAAATAATRYTHQGQFDDSSTTSPAGWAEAVEP